MDHPRDTYNPAKGIEAEVEVVTQPEDLQQLQARIESYERATIGASNAFDAVQNLVARKQEWEELDSEAEFIRLHEALMNLKGN